MQVPAGHQVGLKFGGGDPDCANMYGYKCSYCDSDNKIEWFLRSFCKCCSELANRTAFGYESNIIYNQIKDYDNSSESDFILYNQGEDFDILYETTVPPGGIDELLNRGFNYEEADIDSDDMSMNAVERRRARCNTWRAWITMEAVSLEDGNTRKESFLIRYINIVEISKQ